MSPNTASPISPGRTLVFTATYNEAADIARLLQEIHRTIPTAAILVVDDNSPDGTGAILDALAMQQPHLTVIHRPTKLGVGSAHKLAIKYAADRGYDALVTMDADFSHDPLVLPLLLAGLNDHFFVIGTRFIAGGSLDYRNVRRLISKGANSLSHFVLGVAPRETTTSYRAFRRDLLETLPIDDVQADGYSFFLECTYLISLMTDRILEVPIRFRDRQSGKSKISHREIWLGFLTVGRLAVDRVGRGIGVKGMPPVLKASRRAQV